MENLKLVFTGSEEWTTITNHIALVDTGPSRQKVSHAQYLASQFLSVVPVLGPEGTGFSSGNGVNG